MSKSSRRFRSISEIEAQVIWSVCKQSSLGRWSGITQAVEEIRRMRRGGSSITRQTISDFLKAHPKPEQHPEFVGRRGSVRIRENWEDLPKPVLRPYNNGEIDEKTEELVLKHLDSIRWGLWKNGVPLLESGGFYSRGERRA